jgi:diguanylate cyclase (GGDEF)-like protein/excisionase family DNA binding protein
VGLATSGSNAQERQTAGMSDQPVRVGTEPSSTEEWIGIDAAAAHLAIPVRTLYRLAQRGQVPAAKVGRTWRFKRSMLDRFLAAAAPGQAGTDAPAPAWHASGGPEATGTSAHAQAGSDRDSLGTITALADLSAGLSSMLNTSEIANYLGSSLVSIFNVDMAGLLRLDGDDVVTVTEGRQMRLPIGTRFPLERMPDFAMALAGSVPVAITDLVERAADDPFSGDPVRAGLVRRFGLRSVLLVPVPATHGPWGLLVLATREPRTFTPLELDRLQAVAGQTGLALTNARLLAETRRWSDQLERIEALGRQLNRSRDMRAVAEAVAAQVDTVIDWHGLRFYVLAEDGETLEPIVLRGKVGYYASETPDMVRLRLGLGLGGHIARSRVAEIVPDVLHDPRMHNIPGTDDVDESMLVVPLVHDDEIMGVLELSRLGLSAFDSDDLRLLQIVGAQAAVALHNARQVEELERRSSVLERRLASQRQLLAITERLLVTRERGAIFEAVADTLAEVVPHDTVTIYLVDRTAGCLVPILARDEYAEQILATRPAIGAGITGNVIEQGEAEVINDANNDPRVVHVPGTPEDQDESMIVAPVNSPEGVIGALNLYRSGRHFDLEDLELVRLFANHVAIALENATVHDRLVDAARADPLTGLPNRRFFTERVEHALARRARLGTRIAVLFLDLDGFKLVNDGLGHAAGDDVLIAVANRIQRCMRAADTVARLGGDEFGVLLEDVTAPEEPVIAANRIADALRVPLRMESRIVSVRASIGVTLDDGGTAGADELLRNADTAMYRAKAGGRGGFALFEPAMHAAQLARLELEGELREAIERAEFKLRCQPIVDLGTGAIAGVEALVRWHHPARGLIPPVEFIPVAEESGQIVQIGSWVLREACRTLRRWQAEGLVDGSMRMSVNTSVRQLIEASFVEIVDRALADNDVAADSLVLEITESVMLADETAAIGALRALRARGVHIAVDDFGTGYSSLGYLKRLPVDGLKIDRSFIDGLGVEREKTAIVKAALAFARALDLSVTAEGIETDLQLEHLASLGCALGQGYRFAPALEPESLAELLRLGTRFPVPTVGAAAIAHEAGEPAA